MTKWEGKFFDGDIKLTEDHQTAETPEEKAKKPLPQRVRYVVPEDLAQQIILYRRENASGSAEKRSSSDAASRNAPPPLTIPASGAAALAERIATSVTYMDVGCWGGSGPGEDEKKPDAKDHWRKKRHFGIVFGGLSVLCAYKRWKYSKKDPVLEEAKTLPAGLDPKWNDQYKKILPLLTALSQDPKLGPVVVLQAVLNNQPGLALPPDDRIHVILGDLHAPVMTDLKRTYSDRPHPARRPASPDHATDQATKTSTATGSMSSQLEARLAPHADTARARYTDPASGAAPKVLDQVPGKSDWNTGLEAGLSGKLGGPAIDRRLAGHGEGQSDRHVSIDAGISGTRYPLRGRFDRGSAARILVPVLSRIFGAGSRFIAKDGSMLVKIGSVAADVGAAPGAALLPAALLFGATGMTLADLGASTWLWRWSDEDAGDISVVEDWFDRYHGTKDKLGADVFDNAAEDLLSWLRMIKAYQAKAEPRAKGADRPPVKLMQLGDLFDFWIGLQCPFNLTGGARDFPDQESARKFVEYWLGESLRNEAIRYLWNFDHEEPRVADSELATVYLYGNHDTYMGSQLVAKQLPGRFVDRGLGLIAQHGHQDDFFNNEPTAGLGYLLTQAVFLDNYVRSLEDSMGSAKTKLLGGLWTRLGYNEAALKACVFDRGRAKQPLASTFVMGHTHEPALQRIDITWSVPAALQRASTWTGLEFTTPDAKPPAVLATGDTERRTDSGAAMAGPRTLTRGSAVKHAEDGDWAISTKIRTEGIRIPRRLVCSAKPIGRSTITVSFVEARILAGNKGAPWNMTAAIRAAAKQADEVSTRLLEGASMDIGEARSLPGKSIEVHVGPDDQAEILIHGWQAHHDAGVVTGPEHGAPHASQGLTARLWDYAFGRTSKLTPEFHKAHPESDVVSVRVHPHTWKRRSSLACKHFHVTLDIAWKCEPV